MEFAIWALVVVAALNQATLMWLHRKLVSQWEISRTDACSRHDEWMSWHLGKDETQLRMKHLECVLKKHHDARYSKTDPGDECGACKSELMWPFGAGKIKEAPSDDES